MAMLLSHEIEEMQQLQVNHPCFQVDPRLAEFPELSTVAYRVFPGCQNRDPKQLIAVSFAVSELPEERWPLPDFLLAPRIDDQMILVAIYWAVDHLGGKSVGAGIMKKQLKLYGLSRGFDTLRDSRHTEERRKRLNEKDPRQARIAESLGYALAHAADKNVRLQVQVIRAERAQVVLPMHRPQWQGTAHGYATG